MPLTHSRAVIASNNVYLATFCMGNVKIDAFPRLLEEKSRDFQDSVERIQDETRLGEVSSRLVSCPSLAAFPPQAQGKKLDKRFNFLRLLMPLLGFKHELNQNLVILANCSETFDNPQ
jgi:hypothetical protein